MTAIKEVAVMGFPDEILGESIVAFITTHDNAHMSEKEILKECSASLEMFMVPQKIFFLDEMPKNINGKFDKLKLKNEFRNGLTT